MRRNYLRSFVPLLLAAVLAAGCVTNGGQPEEPGKTPINQTELPGVREARELIIYGSPDSLLKAYNLLRSSPAGNSPEGQKLVYITEQLMQILFPRISFEAGVSFVPSTSVYPQIFEDVKEGEFSVLLQDWDSALMLLAVSCAALYTDDQEVLTLCSAAARAASGNNDGKESVLPPYILGIIGKKREKFENALAQLKRSYTRDDSMYPAKWESVKILRRTGGNGMALLLLEELVRDFPRDIQFQLELSSCYLDTGSVRKAMEAIGGIDIQEEHDRYDEYLLLKSRIEEAAGRTEAAADTAELYRQRNPDNLSAVKRYGMLLLELGKTEKGIAVLEIALGKGLDDRAANRKLLAYYAENEMWEEAEEIADRLYDALEEAEFIALSAGVYMQLGRYERAEELAERLVRIGPENAGYYALYAEVLAALGKRAEAETAVETALSYSTSRQQRSNLYLLLGRIAEERKKKAEMLQNALFENMENVKALLEIAYLYRGSGEFRKAYRYIKQAAVLAPDNKRVRNLYAELEGLIGE